MTPKTQIRLCDALKRIASFDSPEWMRKNAERAYGLSPEEAIEMAYENVIEEARSAIKGIRRPNIPPTAAEQKAENEREARRITEEAHRQYRDLRNDTKPTPDTTE